MNFSLQNLLRLVIFGVLVALSPQALAQSQAPATAASSLCNRDNATEMIKQQVEVTRTFDNPVQRITVLIRVADLLWPIEQEKARTVFKEAFEVAIQKEKDESARSAGNTSQLMFTPDQRYVVIRAVTKRDPVWAKKLTEQILKLDRQTSEEASTKNSLNEILTAQKLLDSARQLLSTDANAALDLARTSLRYPATAEISRFLYALAEMNQPAADQFYDQALVVYADRPMREFLYLQEYPFAFSEGGDMPVFGNYVVPANFAVNNSLQRRFVQVLLRRAEQALEVPLDEGDNFNWTPGTGHIMQVLLRVEPHVRQRNPDLSEAVVQAREKIRVSLPLETQKALLPSGRGEDSPSPRKTFEEQIETAEKTPNINAREDLIAEAVLSASDKESLASVVEAIDKITDSSIRGALFELLYFKRAKEAAKNKRFDEAEDLVSKIEGHEQRAYLYIEIARGLLNSSETQTHARELLERAIHAAVKGQKTMFAARTRLTASNLYTKIDMGRAISVLGDSIDYINRLAAPDFTADDQTLVKRVKRRNNPGHFVFRFYMPGIDPETALREMAKLDFDGALSQSNALNDKFQRAVTTLALADFCLQKPKPRLLSPKSKRIR